jgi:hypothetical protein
LVVPAAAPEIAKECAEAGVGADRCEKWLAVKYQHPECLAAGIATREGCETFLQKQSKPVEDKALLGFASADGLAQVRKELGVIVNVSTEVSSLPEKVREILPVISSSEERVFILPSRPSEKATLRSSLGFVIQDGDADGLPDDAETRMGTDPKNPDTDGDGFPDGIEARNGYNPLGTGKLQDEKKLAPVESAIVQGKSLEEPRDRQERVNEGFKVSAAETLAPVESKPEETPKLQLTGTADPNSVVTIYVYSYLPIVVTTTTDANGNWTYDFSSTLADGRHEAYVAVNDADGGVVETSGSFTFFVREARAASEEDFLRADLNVPTPAEFDTRMFVYGGIALVLIATLLVLAIIRQSRKPPEILS